MKILLIFSTLGYNRGGLRILITSTQKCSKVEVTHYINRKKDGQQGSIMRPDNAKWKNIYI